MSQPSSNLAESTGPALDHLTDVGKPTAERSSQAQHGWVKDWRTIDPESIRKGGILVAEQLLYREKLDDLLRDGEGRLVLIVGSEIISFFDDLTEAAEYAIKHYGGRPVLIKKVAATEPIHSFGGAVVVSDRGIGESID